MGSGSLRRRAPPSFGDVAGDRASTFWGRPPGAEPGQRSGCVVAHIFTTHGRQPPRPLAAGGPKLSRRRLLQIGSLGGLGLNLASAARWAAASPAEPARQGLPPLDACILIFYYGGPSHIDTWDPKPLAPREVRGEFAPIQSRVPGLWLTEQVPHTAGVAEHLAVVRSLHHPMRNHNSAAVEALCGRTPLRGDLELLANDPATDFPCYGSAVGHLVPPREQLPVSVALPHVMYNVVMLPGQTAGFLGPAFDPLRISADPNAVPFRVPELELPADFTFDKLASRHALWQSLDGQLASLRAARDPGQLDHYYQRAFSLLESNALRQALALDQETAARRERYGRTTHGQSVLLACRLVEAGVRFVSVYDRVHNGLNNWDTHLDNFGRLKNDLLPPTDRSLAALIADLAEQGRLERTLVVALGEFGRTPMINAQAGRDHWPDCYSVILAGGGVVGGAIHGQSDRLGSSPAQDPATPGDLAATIFWRFGLDPHQEVFDPSGRPYRLAEGEPLRNLFGVG